MLTFDSRVVDAKGTQAGAMFNRPLMTRDGKTVDSTGAFLVGELERLDQTMNPPLASVTYPRDIDLREDVTMADEVSSFTTSAFASAGGLGSNGIASGKAWMGKVTNQTTGVDIDIDKTPNPLTIWGMEVKYTIPELESAARLGRPVDQQKYEAMQLKHQMDIDAMVYIGDTDQNATGLCNNALITPAALPNGVSGSSRWATKSPDEILADVNLMLVTTWQNSALAVMPDRLLLPPVQFGYIATQKVSQAGNVSILKYILENNILTTSGMGKLQIFPVKWLIGAGSGGTLGTAGTVDRAVVYLKEYSRVRFPMTLLQRTPIQYESLYHKTTYFCRLGRVEIVYTQTIGYYDGL
jgi:hypothetical protein